MSCFSDILYYAPTLCGISKKADNASTVSNALLFQHILYRVHCTYYISLFSLRQVFQWELPSKSTLNHITLSHQFGNLHRPLNTISIHQIFTTPNSTPSPISFFAPFSTNKARSNWFQIGIHKHLHHLPHLFQHYQLFLNITLAKLSIPFSGISPYALSCRASSGVYFMIISALSSWKSRSPINTISPTPIHTFESKPAYIHYLLSHFSTDIAKSSFSIKAVAFHSAISKHLINSSIF